jgi:alginate O-acetyltransferase complex protein AlgI
VLFNSLTFLAFFAIVLALHYAPLPWQVKKFNLLIASYIFYGACSPPFVLLLWFSTAIDWFVAKRLDVTEAVGGGACSFGSRWRPISGCSAISNTAGFSMKISRARWAPTASRTRRRSGTSCCRSVSRSTPSKRCRTRSTSTSGRSKPAKSFLDFALFVTFFPQLVAGPIVRPTDLLPQFATPRTATGRQFGWG